MPDFIIADEVNTHTSKLATDLICLPKIVGSTDLQEGDFAGIYKDHVVKYDINGTLDYDLDLETETTVSDTSILSFSRTIRLTDDLFVSSLYCNPHAKRHISLVSMSEEREIASYTIEGENLTDLYYTEMCKVDEHRFIVFYENSSSSSQTLYYILFEYNHEQLLVFGSSQLLSQTMHFLNNNLTNRCVYDAATSKVLLSCTLAGVAETSGFSLLVLNLAGNTLVQSQQLNTTHYPTSSYACIYTDLVYNKNDGYYYIAKHIRSGTTGYFSIIKYRRNEVNNTIESEPLTNIQILNTIDFWILPSILKLFFDKENASILMASGSHYTNYAQIGNSNFYNGVCYGLCRVGGNKIASAEIFPGRQLSVCIYENGRYYINVGNDTKLYSIDMYIGKIDDMLLQNENIVSNPVKNLRGNDFPMLKDDWMVIRRPKYLQFQKINGAFAGIVHSVDEESVCVRTSGLHPVNIPDTNLSEYDFGKYISEHVFEIKDSESLITNTPVFLGTIEVSSKQATSITYCSLSGSGKLTLAARFPGNMGSYANPGSYFYLQVYIDGEFIQIIARDNYGGFERMAAFSSYVSSISDNLGGCAVFEFYFRKNCKVVCGGREPNLSYNMRLGAIYEKG